MQTDEFITQLASEGAKKAFPTPRKVAAIWVAAMIVYSGIIIALFGIRHDVAAQLTNPIYLTELLSMLATAIISAWAASWLALPDTNQKPWVRFLPLIPLVLLMGTLLYSILTTDTVTLTECLKLGRYDCISDIVLFSLVPGIIMFYTIQKEAPVQCCWAGSIAGLSAVSFGYVILRLIEKHDDPVQLVVWHFVPVVAVMTIGMIVGKACLSRTWKS